MQIFEGNGSVGFGEPVGYKQGEIEATVAEAAFGDCGTVELVNAYGGKLDLRSGMLSFELTGLFSKRVFKIGIVADGYAQVAHAASGRVAEYSTGLVCDMSMTRIEQRRVAAAVYRAVPR